MKCLERGKLFELAHQMLEPPEAEAVREHLSACETCRATLTEYQRLDGALDEWKAPAPSPWFDARLRAHLATEKEGGFWGVWGFFEWRRWVLPATIVALAVLAIVVFLQSPRPPGPVVKQEARPTEAVRPTEVAQAEKPAARPVERPAAAPTERVEVEDEGYFTVEDYDLIADFDVLSELPGREHDVVR